MKDQTGILKRLVTKKGKRILQKTSLLSSDFIPSSYSFTFNLIKEHRLVWLPKGYSFCGIYFQFNLHSILKVNEWKERMKNHFNLLEHNHHLKKEPPYSTRQRRQHTQLLMIMNEETFVTVWKSGMCSIANTIY